MSKPIGIMLTIAGLVLGAWFVGQAMQPGPVQLPAFVVAAIAAAMVSVGARYILKGTKADAEKRARKKAEKLAKAEAKKTQQGPAA
ncbi:MAG TPA: hypothetical protein VGO52_16420 [Hyphomonadaceae bacterium]|jgi:hypothetical protein|nr:hypothetical protein [Hyphomonadaceae bacterium]